MLPVDLTKSYPMLHFHRGILFSSRNLQSHAFLIFLSFVAVNTLVYLGITLLKLLPRPKPQLLLHPRVLRLLPPPKAEPRRRKGK